MLARVFRTTLRQLSRSPRTCQARDVTGRRAKPPGRKATCVAGSEQLFKALELLKKILGNGVTVAQQTLTLFVLVRIQVPQPLRRYSFGPASPSCRVKILPQCSHTRRSAACITISVGTVTGIAIQSRGGGINETQGLQ